MNEATLQARILQRATELGARLFRNSIARTAVVGRKIESVTEAHTARVYAGDYIVRRGALIQAGLAVGSGDLIGWTPAIVGGEQIAVFTSVEVKSQTGVVRAQQAAWRDTVDRSGGIAIVARSMDDYEGTVGPLLP